MSVVDRLSTVGSRAPERAKPLVRWGLEHGLPAVALRRSARRDGDLQARLSVESGQHDTDGLQPLLEEIRARGPIHRSKFAYVTVEHEAVREVLSSPDVSSGFAPAEGIFRRALDWSDSPTRMHPLQPPSLLVTEPPDHTRYRKLVTRVFSVRAVEQLRERTEQIANDLLNDLAADAAAGRPVDIAQRYCTLLPVTVIAEILGVPEQDRADVLRMGSRAAASLDLGVGWREYRDIEDSLAEFDTWMGRHLERISRNPGDDLLSQLVAARDDGVGLTERELRGVAGLVLVAGFETTVNLLSNGIALLDRHPDQLEVLRQQPDLWANAVDEVLRLDPPVLLTGRTVVRDTEIRGVRLPAGAIVTTVLAGANRDPEVFDDPHRFDVTRENARDHIAFSAGRHFCLGAALARMEGEVGLRALHDRYGTIRVLPAARRRPTRILRGFEHLPVRLSD